MDKLGQIYEQFKVHASELGDKVRELIKEGNVRRIIIKDEQGHTFMEIPLTVATVGVVLAPILAAVGAIATLVAHFQIVVERSAASAAAPTAAPGAPGASATDSSVGATETNVNMADTVSTDTENRAGDGKPDSLGG